MGSSKKLHYALRYSPMLDGIRGLAVLGVMLVHTPIPYTHWGYLGVDVFFTLSGFLITTVLLTEWAETGSVNLKNFYARRALRLLPALSLLLLVSLLPMNPIPMAARIKAALIALFYSSNWVRALVPDFHLKALAHTWSLSIEEQFYLLWPIALLTLLRFEKTRRRIGPILAAAIIACLGCRAILWTAGSTPMRLYNGLDTRADSLLAGCILSVLLAFGILKPASRPGPIAKIGALLVMIPGLVWVFISEWDSAFMFLAGYTLVAVAAAAVIYYAACSPGNSPGGLLAFRPLVWTGRISYGLYLWHYPVFPFILGLGLPVPLAVAGMFIAVYLIATLSYYCLEMPFLRMKQKLKSGRKLVTSSPE